MGKILLNNLLYVPKYAQTRASAPGCASVSARKSRESGLARDDSSGGTAQGDSSILAAKTRARVGERSRPVIPTTPTVMVTPTEEPHQRRTLHPRPRRNLSFLWFAHLRRDAHTPPPPPKQKCNQTRKSNPVRVKNHTKQTHCHAQLRSSTCQPETHNPMTVHYRTTSQPTPVSTPPLPATRTAVANAAHRR